MKCFFLSIVALLLINAPALCQKASKSTNEQKDVSMPRIRSITNKRTVYEGSTVVRGPEYGKKTYDEDGNLIQEKEIDLDHELIYTYDSRHNKLSQLRRNDNGQNEFIDKYTYDDKNFMLTERFTLIKNPVFLTFYVSFVITTITKKVLK